jgi:glyoxylase-like metal-dependent hydrolase (beta-lactamase superfamily II)
VDNIVNVTGGKGGNAFLVLGQEKTALIDCGMAYCAAALIGNLRQALNGRTLDYLLITHSHYDHIGACPYLKENWPNMKLQGAEYAKQILTRKTALQTIRMLGVEAAEFFGAAGIDEYDDKLLQVDYCIGDGDIIELGGMSIQVLKTTGHTKCSLSFLLNKDILFASESAGYMSKSGKIYPAFITSSVEALESVALCQKLKPTYIISPHYGLVKQQDTPTYWECCRLAIMETREFIIESAKRGCTKEQMLAECENRFRDEQCRLEQPLVAFQLNAQFMIKSVLKEWAAGRLRQLRGQGARRALRPQPRHRRDH